MSKELNLWHIRILQKLADEGPLPLVRFNEVWCDDLFRARPRLIALVAGCGEPVVDITTEGRQVLTGRLVNKPERKAV
jgi:hypothetical protein